MNSRNNISVNRYPKDLPKSEAVPHELGIE